MTAYLIEKEIPLSNKTHRGRMPNTGLKFPWADMQVGDSFFVPVGNQDMVHLMNKITASGRGYFGKGCVKARAVSETEFGVRVWRIA